MSFLSTFLSYSCHCHFPIIFLNWWQCGDGVLGRKNLVWKVPAFATFWFADWVWDLVFVRRGRKIRTLGSSWNYEDLSGKKTTLHFFHVPDPTLFVRKEAGGLGCSLREEEMVTGTGIVEGEAGGMTGQNLSLKTVFSKVHGPLLALSLPKEGSMHLLKVLWAVLGPQTLSWPLGSYGPEEDWFQKRIP